MFEIGFSVGLVFEVVRFVFFLGWLVIWFKCRCIFNFLKEERFKGVFKKEIKFVFF